MTGTRIPPLTALRAFDAAVRLGSHQAAARAIGRTPSAVTHQIRLLETHLGAALFRRSGRTLALTAEGELYAEATTRALGELSQGEALIRRRREARGVRLNVAPGFAILAAIPHIAAFEAANPDLPFSLDIDTRSVSLDGTRADAAVRIGGGPWPGLLAERLFGLHLVPMAAPSLWASIGPDPDPARLATLPLIDFVGTPHLWEEWFAAHGQGLAVPPRRFAFDNSASGFQMAEEGAGVILGSLPLGAALLRSGRLLAPIDKRLEDSRAYYFVYPTADRGDSRIAALRQWLKGVVEALGEDGAAVVANGGAPQRPAN